MTTVIGCLGLIPAMALSTVLRAWAIVTLWTWFIYPTWHIAIPSKPAAVGLAILIAAIAPPRGDSEREPGRGTSEIFLDAYGALLLPPLFAVGLGWIVKSWM